MNILLTILVVIGILLLIGLLGSSDIILLHIKNSRPPRREIYKKLPKYHPVSGQELRWDIDWIPPKMWYDKTTGKQHTSGTPRLSITQHDPGMPLVDFNVYYYDWNKQKIERVSCARW